MVALKDGGGKDGGDTPTRQNWRIDVVLDDDEGWTSLATFGVDSAATVGFDAVYWNRELLWEDSFELASSLVSK